jgi:hypothetical protein
MSILTAATRLYARRRHRQLGVQNPSETQQRQLLSLVKKSSTSRFGTAHDFGRIRSVADFQKAVPLGRYEDFWEQWWQDSFPILDNCTWPGRIPYFALSSGTSSGTTKYIPCSREMILSNRKAGVDLLVHHLINRPDSAILGGKLFMLGGSTDLRKLAPGVYAGDLSGIAAATAPPWLRPKQFPPLDIALMSQWEEKMQRLAVTAAAEDIRMISGVPSWLNLFFAELARQRQLTDISLKSVLPNVEMVVHGGVSFQPYRQQYRDLIADSRAELREVYPASEGFIAVADRGSDEGLRLILDHGIFFEFVPVEEIDHPSPTRHWVTDIEPRVNYAVVLSNCAGLWGYILGDTISFTECNPPRLHVTGRLSYMLSAFGEHLIGEEIEDAVSSGAESIGTSVVEFSVGAIVPENSSEPGYHRYVVEFAENTISDAARKTFINRVDDVLMARNEDYAAHRQEGYGMDKPQLLTTPPGAFTAWMKKRGKLGGQHKVPRIITDAELFASLQSSIEEHAGHPSDGK